MFRHRSAILPFVLFFAILPLLQIVPAAAWKPYTHNYTGDRAWEDVVADGKVTINGREYTVDARVRTALQNHQAFYNAGVVGPDGFPDLTYGQSVIHSEETGKWIEYIYTEAWNAQTDSRYNATEREQILAFAYGYLTHAAGDMWAHTIVNDFAVGVFPPVSEVLTEKEKAEIALRHIIIEGYIGDTTPGYDGNPDRGPAPNGDISDDSTPGTAFDAPHRFVYNILIDPNAPTPLPNRGPILDFFIELRTKLAAEVSSSPQPLQAALNAYNDTRVAWESVKSDCDFGASYTNADDITFDVIHDVVACPVALATLGITVAIDSFEAFMALFTETLALAADVVFDSYLAAWIDDIDEGLKHWNELGLASTRALFDAQTYRDTQNDECGLEGAENSQNRINCEDGIGALDVVFHEADPFINTYLLSMLGAPDFVGGLRQAIQDLSEQLAVLGIPFNPLEEGLAQLTELAKEYVKDLVEEAYGIDIDQMTSFLKHPTHWLNVQDVTIALPGVGPQTLTLFQPNDHDRLDGILQLSGSHHVPSNFPSPGASTRLSDDSVFSPETFAPIKNTITTAKLLLLDGAELNRAVGDLLTADGVVHSADKVQTYPQNSTNGVPTNIMFQPLSGTDPWLISIDSDHAWRENGLPRFCDIGSPLCTLYPELNPTPLPRSMELNGGTGNFPIWESCLMRPAFRDLYTDWENGTQNFPDYGDDVAADPSDPNPPVSALTVSGTTFTDPGGTIFIGGAHEFGLSATDDVFQNGKLNPRYAFYADGAARGAWQASTNPGAFTIPGGAGDGIWKVDFQSEDPCHTFIVEGDAASDPLPPETLQTQTYVLDTTPPVITYTSPDDGQIFDTDDLSSIGYSVDDGPLGSGVKSHSVTFDGQLVTNGYVLDMFYLWPGTHTIAVTATDNLDNTRTVERSFEVHATAESLVSNVIRAKEEGLISHPNIYQGLKAKVDNALRVHDRVQHSVEWAQLSAFVNQLKAQRGKGIDAATADRFIAYAEDLIALGR